MTFDSRIETYEHQARVRELLLEVAKQLIDRAHAHDASKLVSPEVEAFNEIGSKLKTLTYGSDEYKASLADLGPALQHHYAYNSHHPEFYTRGIHGMDMLDLVELLCDWKAATERMASGDVRKSVAINQERFGYSDELAGFMHNTLDMLEAH